MSERIDDFPDLGVLGAADDEPRPRLAAASRGLDLGSLTADGLGDDGIDFNIIMTILFPDTTQVEKLRLFVAGMVSGKGTAMPSPAIALAVATAARLDRFEVVTALSLVMAGIDPTDKKFTELVDMVLKTSAQKAETRELKGRL
jgi:hypothetical protein